MPARRQSTISAPAASEGADLRFLQRIGLRWYCRYPVPRPLRPELGPYLRKALGTGDLREAQHRRWDVVGWARGEIERRAGAGGKPGRAQTSRPRDATYDDFRARLRDAGPARLVDEDTGEVEDNPAFERAVDALADSHAARDGAPPVALVEAVHDERDGREPVSALLKDYLEHNPKRSATTAANYDTTVRLWIAHHGDRPIQRATRKGAVEWLDASGKGKARDTIKRYATVMGHLWDWAHRLEDAPPANPFSNLQRAAAARGKATESYGVFDAAELRAVFAALSADRELKAVALVALFSGMRLSECLSAVRIESGGVACWQVQDGKTNNAARLVPVHPALAQVSIPKASTAAHLSVRFGRLLKGARLADGSSLPEGKTFHSLRKCFSTALEQAGCPEVMAVRLLGHAPLSMSYRVYSQGLKAADLKPWVDRISFVLE